MGNNQSNTSLPIEGTNRWVEFENNWFAEGRSRRAYRGTYRGQQSVEGGHCVVKLYKDEWYSKLRLLAYKVDLQASERAQEMALAFNRRHPAITPIEFVQPEISRINSSAAFKFLGLIRIPKKVKGTTATDMSSSTLMIPVGATVAIERYLEGQFINFLSNTAHQDETIPGDVPAAFSHFTYHHSHARILVCDLKGIRGEQGYVLTDPAIHNRMDGCGAGYFGPTDLGYHGMVKFFQNHRCSNLCQDFIKLDLSTVTRSIVQESSNIESRRPSLYSIEMHSEGADGLISLEIS